MRPRSIKLAILPTPLYRLDRTSAEWEREVWIKRDDLTGCIETGNKIRKLEFIMQDALEMNADIIITCGGEQSNHCRATATVARKLGLNIVLFLRRTGEGATGNWLLDLIFDADFVWLTPEEYKNRNQIMERERQRLIELGHRPYVIPEGASNSLGALGYFEAANELHKQFSSSRWTPDYIVFPSGSGGTYAGLWLGFKVVGIDSKIIGISAGPDVSELTHSIWDIAQEMNKKYKLHLSITQEEISILDNFWQPGYGLVNNEHIDFIANFGKREGIILGPTYTGKAFLAVRKLCENGTIPKGSKVLLIHTGGAFGIFSKGEMFRQRYFSHVREKQK